MTRKLAIIGASYIQRPLVEKANKLGLETHVFAWTEGNEVEDIADFFYNISTLEKESILKKCREIKIDGIVSIGSDIAMDTVNYIASELGLIGNSINSTNLTRDKHLMRKKLSECGLQVPRFQLLKKKEDIDKLPFSFPFMVKATDRSGSRGIALVKNALSAREAFEDAKEVSLNKKVLGEEYFEGKQFSVEMISQNGEHYFVGITEEFYSGPPFFVEKGQMVPGRINNLDLASIISLTKKSLRCLGIENGASHTELRINVKKELCIIEIAGRMGGDFRSRLIELAHGYDYIENVINVSLNKSIEKGSKAAKNISFIKWFLTKEELSKLSKLEIEYDLDCVNIFEGTKEISKTKSSNDRLGYAIGSSNELPLMFLDLV